jgi:hypothetical protein
LPGLSARIRAPRWGDPAQHIASESGLKWKIWTGNEAQQTASGVYLLSDRASAGVYLATHRVRLVSLGIENIRAMIFDVNPDLTAITRGPAD